MKPEHVGRFDKSFAYRMIRDFFFVLLIVTLLELAISLSLKLYRFATEGESRTQVTAEQLASDLKDVMLNRGGPVAARTIYPTWQRLYEHLGFEIAVSPSKATVESIEERFDFTPEGIPAEFPRGRHHQSVVTLDAEPFCVNCHVEAKPGDVLGEIEVRRYLSGAVTEWADGARLTALVGTINIILGTIILYWLLKVRMEPLLALRSTVSRLAKGRLDLSYRAPTRSEDEFGELAMDLNHFLDRMSEMCEELRDVLRRVLDLNDKMNETAAATNRRLVAVNAQARRMLEQRSRVRRQSTELSSETLDAVDLGVSALELLVREGAFPADLRGKLQDAARRFRSRAGEARDALRQAQDASTGLSSLCDDLRAYSGTSEELDRLIERMEDVAQSGRALLAQVTVARGDQPEGSGRVL
ncbi:MAG: HAMP domain-containing protein [Gammaproteobacteria bacterium]|nr:HAMP domain-containing protein [Gammaproteobacteria bacterium]